MCQWDIIVRYFLLLKHAIVHHTGRYLASRLRSKLENLITQASVTCYTDCPGLMLLAKHAVSNSKMRRYLEFLQSFEPAIKLRWQSSKDPSFKIVDFLSRPETVGDPPIVNKNIPSIVDEDIKLRCEKL